MIVGFGGHAKSLADSIGREGKFRIIGYTDLQDRNCGYSYLGTDDVLPEIFNKGIKNAAIGIGFLGKSDQRERLTGMLRDIGFSFPIIVDPSAVVASSVKIGEGTFVGKQAVVNADSRIGDFCIINTGAIIEHDNIVGDYSHIAVGAVLCGEVQIGKRSLVGAGATVIQGICIGDDCVLGAGSVLLKDMPDHTSAYGIPATINGFN